MSTPKYHMDAVFDPQTAHPHEAHSILMRHIPRQSTVLELGCSSGYLSGYMVQSLDCRVIGLEFDPQATALAAEHATAAYTVDLDAPDALAVATDHGPYDVLLAAAVLEHLKYPDRLLREVRPLLTPNARIIVSLPNVAYWQIRLKLLAGHFDYEDYGVMDRTHLKLYTRKTGRELLEDNGYHVDAFHIAGSLVQNMVNSLTRSLGRENAPLILPGLLGYELIYIAHPA